MQQKKFTTYPTREKPGQQRRPSTAKNKDKQNKKRETVLCVTIQNKLPKYMEVMPSNTINVF